MPATLQKIWTDKERKAWRLPPAGLTVSRLAEQIRVIGSYAAEPGPWRNSRAPYLTAIMDAYSEPEVEEIDIAGPRQCGKTEAVFNMIDFDVEIEHIPALYVNASQDNIEKVCTKKLEPMFRDSPELEKHLLASPRSLKVGRVFDFDTMPLFFTSAETIAGLVSITVGRVFLDELNLYPAQIGSFGNPAKLAERCSITFPDRKIVRLSTVTTKNGAISVSIAKSNDQKYQIPCPRCGRYQLLKFANLKIDPPDMRDPEIIRKTGCVYYECLYCAGKIYNFEQFSMLEAGKWVAAGQSIDSDGKIIGNPKRGKRHSGFTITELLSPWLKWPDILAEWFEANETEKIKPGVLREFKNNVLVQVWEEEGKKIEPGVLDKLKGDYSRDTVPDGCKILFAVADYHESQKGIARIDYAVWGFGYSERNWVVSYGSVTSFDLLDKATWLNRFPWSNPDNHKDEEELSVNLMLIDAKYMKDKVYAYCRKRPGLCIPTNGASGRPDTVLKWSELERTKRKSTAMQKRIYDKLLIIDTEFFKDKVTAWCEPEYNEKGEITAEPKTKFYSEIPPWFFSEFSNEHKIKLTDKYGNISYRWVPVFDSAPTHALDLGVLAAAAAWYKKVHLMREGQQSAPKITEKNQIVPKIRTKY
jgi:phage terminase large subunit GpA-like protein